MDYITFGDLAKFENIEKMNLDPALEKIFIRLMRKLQEYFDEHGYTIDYGFDFSDIINSLVLNGDNRLRIYASDETSVIHEKAGGFFERENNRIVINKRILGDEDKLEKILCHEFIHFIVENKCLKNINPNSDIYNGGMINEALTEMLAREIVHFKGNTSGYEQHVRMLRFANILTDSVNDFRSFLKGRIEPKIYNEYWEEFLKQARVYQDDFYNGGFHKFDEALKTKSYIDVQRSLIKMVWKNKEPKSYLEFVKLVRKTSKRVVPDDDWMENFYKEVIKNTPINSDAKEYFTDAMMRYCKISDELEEYDRKSSENQESLDSKIPTPFNKRIELVNEKERLEEMLTSVSNMDIKKILDISEKDKLIKLERFTLPNIDNKLKYVYIATYDDNRMEVLGQNVATNQIHDIKLCDFLGYSERDKIYLKETGKTIEDGFVMTAASDIDDKMTKYVSKKIASILSPEKEALLLKKYLENNPDVIEEYKQHILGYALNELATKTISEMSIQERQAIIKNLDIESTRMIVSTENGKASVALLSGNNAITCDCTVLIDKGKDAPLNNFFQKVNEKKKDNDTSLMSQPFAIDQKGNLVISQDLKQEYYRNEYGKAADKIQALFIENQKDPVPYFEGRLAYLESIRDRIASKMTFDSPVQEKSGKTR